MYSKTQDAGCGFWDCRVSKEDVQGKRRMFQDLGFLA